MKKLICYFVIVCFCMSCPGASALSAVLARGFLGRGSELIIVSEKASVNKLLPNRIIERNGKSGPNKVLLDEQVFRSCDETFITPEIREKAASLGYDANRIFAWVYNEIEHEAYYGSLKGAAETLRDMAGNSYDQCSLLIALLRASGIQALYVRGHIKRSISSLMNLTGAETPEAAIEIFKRNKIPIEAVYNDNEGKIIAAKFEHVWVKAFYRNDRLRYNSYPPPYPPYLPCPMYWHFMDPSYKTYKYIEGEGAEIDENTLLDVLETATTIIDNKLFVNPGILDGHLAEMIEIFEGEYEGKTLEELLGKREIVKIPVNIGGRPLPCPNRLPSEEFPVLPEDSKFKIKIELPGAADYIVPISEIAGKQMSMFYIPAGENDEALIEEYGGIFEVPAYQVYMKPVVAVDGEVVMTGSSIGLGKATYLTTSFRHPGMDNGWESTVKVVQAGARYDLAVITQLTNMTEIEKLSENLEQDLLDAGFEEDDVIRAPDDLIDRGLRLTGMTYFNIIDKFSDYASKLLEINVIRHISLAYTCKEVKANDVFGLILDIAPGGLHIDVVRNVLCPTSTIGNSDDEKTWMITHGAIATNWEHGVIEALYDIEAVSTGKVMTVAARAGIPIHALDDLEMMEIDLEKISAGTAVKDNIRMYMELGFTVMIPQYEVTIGDWTGQGWIVTDEETGNSGFMICGGLCGKGEVMNGGASSIPFGLIVAKLFKILFKIGDLATIPGTAFFIGVMALKSTGFIGGTLFGVFAGVIACIFIAGAVVLFIILWRNLYVQRRYVYA